MRENQNCQVVDALGFADVGPPFEAAFRISRSRMASQPWLPIGLGLLTLYVSGRARNALKELIPAIPLANYIDIKMIVNGHLFHLISR